MSIKRSKEVRRRRDTGEGDESQFTSKPPARTWDWEKNVVPQADAAFIPYVTSSRYAAGTFLMHPVFGKGVVTAANPQRIEVLFQDGPKKLVHGQA